MKKIIKSIIGLGILSGVTCMAYQMIKRKDKGKQKNDKKDDYHTYIDDDYMQKELYTIIVKKFGDIFNLKKDVASVRYYSDYHGIYSGDFYFEMERCSPDIDMYFFASVWDNWNGTPRECPRFRIILDTTNQTAQVQGQFHSIPCGDYEQSLFDHAALNWLKVIDVMNVSDYRIDGYKTYEGKEVNWDGTEIRLEWLEREKGQNK